jgi:hypothetical protein
MSVITDYCKILGVLEKATEPLTPTEVGEPIGMNATYAGRRLYDLLQQGRVEKPDKKRSAYRITEKGKGYLAKPPPEPPAKLDKSVAESAAKSAEESVAESAGVKISEKPPETPPTTTPETTPTTPTDKKVVFPSQADTFSSIGERLGFEKGVSDQKKPSLESVVEYVRSLANMDDLDSVESVLTELGLSPDIRKRWLRLYALTLPAKKAIISPELKVRLGLEEGEGKPKPPQPMYNVIEGKIYPEPDGEYTFAKAVQKVAAEKTSADPAALITAIMPILTKEAPQPSTDTAALITALMPILTKETPTLPPPDTTLFQSLQTHIERLADERNKAQLDALRAEMRSGQRPPEADAQIAALAERIETLRDDLHKQQLERLKEQQEATINLLTNKIDRLQEQVQASITGKQVDSKYGLMSEGLKGILGEIGGARRDIKEIAPTFMGRGKEKPVRTPEQKADFDRGLEQAIESQKKSREMEDKLFFGKEGG